MSKITVKKLNIFAIFGLLLVLIGCNEPPRQVDFGDLPIIDTSNYYLVCPPGYCNINPHEISPVYQLSIDTIVKNWKKLITRESRVSLVAADEQNYKYTFVQVSKVLRLPYTINVEFIKLEHNHTTLAIYSQSKYGFSDFGANKERINNWLDKLSEKLEHHKQIDDEEIE
jgi:uncharacterized protein (DUF1499 family)